MPAPSPSPDALGPCLLPGAMLLRRDAHTLQIGTGPGVLVHDRPGLVRVLRLLDGSADLQRLRLLVTRDVPEFTDDLATTLQRLIASGAVVPPSPPAPEARIAVRHDRSTASLATLLLDAFGPPPPDPDLEILVTGGEPPRSTFENLVSAGVVHLPVVLDERRVRIGPLVAPGVTPCLGCLDAHVIASDPGWAALLPQFERSRLLPQALPPGVLHRAAAEVLHQIECLGRDQRPSTVGHVVSVGPGSVDVEVREVPFALGCACRLLAG